MPEQDLHTFLTNIVEEKEETEDSPAYSVSEIKHQLIPELIELLGYDMENLYFEVALPIGSETISVDAIIAQDMETQPWMVVTSMPENGDIEEYLERLRAFQKVAPSKIGLLLSPSVLHITKDMIKRTYFLDRLNRQDIEEIKELLSPPAAYSNEEITYRQTPTPEKISTDHFELQLDEYEDALQAIDETNSTKDKGDRFEDLAALLFNSITNLSVRERNLYSGSGEMDLVVEYHDSNTPTLFDHFERFLMAECKNIDKSVGLDQVNHFARKMVNAKTSLGFLFTRKGVSGDSGAYALRERDRYFQEEDMMMLIIKNSDLKRIQAGESFYDLIDEKIFELRFDR